MHAGVGQPLSALDMEPMYIRIGGDHSTKPSAPLGAGSFRTSPLVDSRSDATLDDSAASMPPGLDPSSKRRPRSVRPLQEPILSTRELSSDESSRHTSKDGPGAEAAEMVEGAGRWWTKASLNMLCPLTNFPLALLPYPPFKLRADPREAAPHFLVDSRFLAMSIVADEGFVACGRTLEISDLKALDSFVQRCRLGPFRPLRAFELLSATTCGAPARRAAAALELQKLKKAASHELGKLRNIQANRLQQIAGAVADPALAARKGRRARRAAACRTRSLFCIADGQQAINRISV